MGNASIIEQRFHRAMISIYERALSKCNYKATYFRRMVGDYGGVQAAKRLLNNPNIQYGFEKLWECGCLDITMEHLVVQPEWRELFTDDERNIARKRLIDHGFNLD